MSTPTPDWITDAIEAGQSKAAESTIKERAIELVMDMDKAFGKQTAQTAKAYYVSIMAQIRPDELRNVKIIYLLFNAIDEYFEEREG